jgi:hypothetical protein
MTVTGLDIQIRRPLADGQIFGDVGKYEEIRGIIKFAVDPLHPANQRITDIARAPRDADGRVAFESDIVILRPVDAARGSRRILFDVLNRGKRLALSFFNNAEREVISPETPAAALLDVGNGYLMREGWTIVWTGWQADAPPWPALQRLRAPEAMDDDGGHLTGRVFSQFQAAAPVPHFLLSDRDHTPRPALDLDEADALLTVRDHPDTEPQEISRETWQFARDENGSPVTDANHIRLEAGFAPGRMYQLTYTTVGAPVMGLGLLAMRDSISWLKNGTEDSGNPCTGQIDHAYAFGVSQSGRFLRTFLYEDLNRDEDGCEALDGILPHVGGGMRGEFNQRFGQPSKDLPSVIAHMFPFTPAESADTKTGQKGALLERLRSRGSDLKVFFSNTAAEYWRGDASLIHIDPDGADDIAPDPNSRVYALAGSQHGPGFWPLTRIQAADGMKAQNDYNSLDYTPVLRGLLENLHQWAANGIAPPESSYPEIGNNTSTTPETLRTFFEAVPGVVFPPHIPVPRRLDFGPGDHTTHLEILPPRPGEAYGPIVSDIDVDGNEIAGLMSPDMLVPLATYTPWNTRHPDMGAPDQPVGLTGGFRGSTFPFPATKADRLSAGDPRLSIEERYQDRSSYLDAVKKVAEMLAERQLIPAEDIERSVVRAASRWDVFTGGKLG